VTQILPASINTPLFDKAKTKLGLKPKGMPPFYSPATVANAVLYAAEHPVRDVVVGGAGKALIATDKLSPRLLDAMLARFGYSLQSTAEPRSEDAPNDLWKPAGEYNRVEGDFRDQAFRRSAATWLDLHAGIKTAATLGAAYGLGAFLRTRAGRQG
jgi:hypothetical protein